MYDGIAARAKAEKLPLKWRDTLPDSRLALAAAEWVRRTEPEVADQVREGLFRAHFTGERDMGDRHIVLQVLEECGVEKSLAEAGLRDGSVMKRVDDAEEVGKTADVTSTPSWESGGVVVSGLREAEVQKLFETTRTDEVARAM